MARINNAFKGLMSIHWWMSFLYLMVFLAGAIMVRLPGEIFIKSYLYNFHESIGLLTMGALSARIFFLLQVWGKKYARGFPLMSFSWIKKTALHTGLYLFMLVIPISGYFLTNVYNYDVKFFIIWFPRLFAANEDLEDVALYAHVWLAYTFLVFIGVHLVQQWKVVRSYSRKVLGLVIVRR